MRRIRPQPRFWYLLILALLLGFGCSCGVSQYRCRKALLHLEQLNAEKHALKERVDSLRADLDYARTDAYVQRIAREELNMIFPGEIRYVRKD